jgi:cell division protein ZapA
MQHFIPINIVLGGRTYRLKIKTEDEEKVRGMAKQLNEQLTVFKTEYAGKDMQDYLAMVLLWHVSEKLEASPAPDLHTNNLSNLEKMIDKGLED